MIVGGDDCNFAAVPNNERYTKKKYSSLKADYSLAGPLPGEQPRNRRPPRNFEKHV